MLLTNMLRIFDAAAHLRRIVRSRELIFCSRDRTLPRMEYLNTFSAQAKNEEFPRYLWPERWMLEHHRTVTELLYKTVSTLNR